MFAENGQVLVNLGLAIAYAEDVQEIIHTPHGMKYVIEGKIATP